MPDLIGSPVEGAKPGKRDLKTRALHELREFVVMFLYLLVPLSLFVLHRAIALKERGIDYQFSGVAIINALVLAKVMIIAEDMGLGTWRRSRPLIWPILDKSISFAVLFIVIDEAEEVAKGTHPRKDVHRKHPGHRRGRVDRPDSGWHQRGDRARAVFRLPRAQPGDGPGQAAGAALQAPRALSAPAFNCAWTRA